MDNLDLNQLLEQVKILAVQAGHIIMEVYEHADFDVMLKSDNSPLTLADKKSNDVICAGLRNLSPDIPIISEENKAIPYNKRKDFGKCWMVDPLDGTKEFIKKNGEFTVNIALIRDHQPILGVVYVPVQNTLYYGLKDFGSYKLNGDKSQKLRVNSFTKQDPGLRVVCSRSHLDADTQKFIDDLLMPEKIAKGSSLKFLILAEGRAEYYPRLAPTMEWDTAAAQIILEEAGGKVYQADSKNPMRYNKENLLNPYFLATGNQLDA